MKARWASLVAIMVTGSFAVPHAMGQGMVSPGSGAMHRSMAGASTAAGADALGALYWNPATISGLPGSEVVIGSEMILPDIHLSSTVPAGAFGPLGPPVTLSGETRSDSGFVPTSGVGLVYRAEGSPLTFGMGVVTLAAGGVNFPGDPANPILAPTGPLGQFILGPNAASAVILGMLPSASYQVTDRLTVGGGPMIDVCAVSFDPAYFGPTSQANALAPRVYPTGSHSQPFWGGGFRGGMTYKATDAVTVGFSFTSPQWFQTWEFNARDVNGNPIIFDTRFSLPTILSAGVAYTGMERLLLVADLRYFDYRNTQLLGVPVREGGAGWDSVWAVALGARYQLSDQLSVQAGYLYNENPVQSDLAAFNTQLPLINQHTVSLGSHFQVNESIGISLAWVHGFRNSITGSVVELLGNSTTITSEYDSFVFGLHIKFGGPSRKEACVADGSGGSCVTPARTVAAPVEMPGEIIRTTTR